MPNHPNLLALLTVSCSFLTGAAFALDLTVFWLLLPLTLFNATVLVQELLYQYRAFKEHDTNDN